MWRKNFFILAMMIAWIGMILRTLFWWSPNSDDTKIIQYESSWFVEKLSNTWDVSLSWDISKPDTSKSDKSQKDSTEIRVMMPKYFYNSGWKKFAEDLLNNQKVYMKITFIDDLNFYKNLLFSPNFSEADLFLFPYDRNERISARSFNAQQNIQPYFDQLLAPILKENQVTFLPFAADPMIMYATWYTSPSNFYAISEYSLNRQQEKPLSFPLFFGINTEDYKATEWFKREYQDIVRYALMHYFKTNNDIHGLQTRIDSNSLQGYNIEDLNTILNAITAPECKYFPSICLQLYSFVWIRFWFLSDKNIVNSYFSWKKDKFENLSKLPLPFSQIEAPIRIRWRAMPSSLEDPYTINWVYEFIKKYMNDHNEYNLRDSTLSVFKTWEWNWLLDNEHIWIRWYILQSWWDYINTLRWISKFWDLIKYEITAKEFLK